MSEHSPKHGLTRSKGGWVKSINGKTRWIVSEKIAPSGDLADKVYEQRFPELWSDKPRLIKSEIDVATVADMFVEHKLRQHKQGELSEVQFIDYRRSAQDFVDAVGDSVAYADLSPEHFATARTAFSKRFGVHRVARWVIQLRSMFKWAAKPPLRLPPPDYGHEFSVPSKAKFRLSKKQGREKRGAQVFTADEIHLMLDLASPTLRLMILLGLNCAMGPTDVAAIPWNVIDLKAGVIDYARRKTGIERRCVLWPETLDLLKARDRTGELVFATRSGRAYVNPQYSTIGLLFTRLLERCKIRHRGFYCLRRTFRTIADEKGDQRAAARIMGHLIGDIGGVYVEHISDQRLKAVGDYVRTVLLGEYAPGQRGAALLAERRAQWIQKLKAARARRSKAVRPRKGGIATARRS